MSVKDFSPNIATHYLEIKQGVLREKTVSKWTRLWRWVGSALGLCDKTIVSCAHKSLQAIREASSRSDQDKLVVLAGKELDYISAIFSQVPDYQNHGYDAHFYKAEIPRIEVISLGWKELTQEFNVTLLVKLRFKPLLRYLADRYHKTGNEAFKHCAKTLVKSPHEFDDLPFDFEEKNFNYIYLYLCKMLGRHDELKNLPFKSYIQFLHFESQAFKNTALQDAIVNAAKRGDIEFLKCVKNEGYDLLVKNRFGHTCLDVAVRYGHLEVLKWFKQERYNFKEINEINDSLIIQAFTYKELEILKWLKNAGVIFEPFKHQADSLLFKSIIECKIEFLIWLKSEGLLNEPSVIQGIQSLIKQKKSLRWLDTLKWLDENIPSLKADTFKNEYLDYLRVLLIAAQDIKANSPEFGFIHWVLCEKKYLFLLSYYQIYLMNFRQ